MMKQRSRFLEMLRTNAARRQALRDLEPDRRRAALRLIWKWRSLSAAEAERLGIPSAEEVGTESDEAVKQFLDETLRRALEVGLMRELREKHDEELSAFANARAAGHVPAKDILRKLLDEIERTPDAVTRYDLTFEDRFLLLTGVLNCLGGEIHRAKCRSALYFCVHYNREKFRRSMQNLTPCSAPDAEWLVDMAADYLVNQNALYKIDRVHVEEIFVHQNFATEKSLVNLCYLKIRNVASYRNEWLKRHRYIEDSEALKLWIERREGLAHGPLEPELGLSTRIEHIALALFSLHFFTEERRLRLIAHYSLGWTIRELALNLQIKQSVLASWMQSAKRKLKLEISKCKTLDIDDPSVMKKFDLARKKLNQSIEKAEAVCVAWRKA